MVGQLSHELEVNVTAAEAWELYGTLRLAKLVQEELSNVIEKLEIIEGDGEAGTIVKATFVPGIPGFSSHKEKFTKLDHEKHLKEVEMIEGGYLDLGFTLYRFRLEIIEKGNDSCIIKSTVEYDVKEEAAANASLVSIEPLINMAEIAKKFLIKNKAAKDAN